MRILCLNVWGGRLADRLLPWLAAIEADVLCLQEVPHAPDAPSQWVEYRDDGAKLMQRSDLVADLATALPDHRLQFCPAARGDLWHGDRAVPCFWGLATLTRRDLPVIGQVQGFVHGAYSADGFGPHPRSRTGHSVRLYDAGSDRCVTVAQMHGLRDPAGKHDTPARHAQARRFLDLIAGVAESGDAIVACGDFNVLPGSATFDLLAEAGLADLVTGHGHDDTRTSFYAKPERHADYMLVNERLFVTRFEVVAEPEVSDHRPLMLEMHPA